MDKENIFRIEEKELQVDRLRGFKENYNELFSFLENNKSWDRTNSKGYEITLVDSLGNTLLDVIDDYYSKHMPNSVNRNYQSKIISLNFYGKNYLIRKKLNSEEFSIISSETNNNDNFNQISFNKILDFIEIKIEILKSDI